MDTWYILSCPADPAGPDPALLTYLPDDDARGWETGQRFSTDPHDFPEEQVPPEPVRFRIAPSNAGALRELWEAPAPVMTRRLADALRAAGVTHLDTYAAVIEDVAAGVVHDDYVAFNLVGLAVVRDGRLQWLDPHAFGSAEPPPLCMFRLKSMPYYIIVHARIRAALEAAGFDTLRFTDGRQYAL